LKDGDQTKNLFDQQWTAIQKKDEPSRTRNKKKKSTIAKALRSTPGKLGGGRKKGTTLQGQDKNARESEQLKAGI